MAKKRLQGTEAEQFVKKMAKNGGVQRANSLQQKVIQPHQ